MWLLNSFMKNPAAATLNSRIYLPLGLNIRLVEGALASYYDAVNYFLEAHVTDDSIPKMDSEITHFTQPYNVMPMEYEGAPGNRALSCHRVYDEKIDKGIFTDVLHGFIRQSIRSHWCSRKNAQVHDLAHHRMSFSDLQDGSKSSNTWQHIPCPTNAVITLLIGGALKSLQQSPTSFYTRETYLPHNHPKLLPHCWWHSRCSSWTVMTPWPHVPRIWTTLRFNVGCVLTRHILHCAATSCGSNSICFSKINAPLACLASRLLDQDIRS